MYQHILVAADGSPTSALALQEAGRLAGAGGRVRIVHVVENPAWSVPLEPGVVIDMTLVHDALLKAGRSILERAEQSLAGRGFPVESLLVDLAGSGQGSIPNALLQEAARWPADLIVIGTHGRRGWQRLFMGSVAETVLRSATQPVLLVRTPDGARLPSP